MKLTIVGALGALMLAGCYTFPELKESGSHYSGLSAQSPRDAAECVAGKIPDVNLFGGVGGFAAQTRKSAGGFEVLITMPGNPGIPNIAIVEVQATASGSNMQMSIVPQALYKDTLAATMKGC